MGVSPHGRPGVALTEVRRAFERLIAQCEQQRGVSCRRDQSSDRDTMALAGDRSRVEPKPVHHQPRVAPQRRSSRSLPALRRAPIRRPAAQPPPRTPGRPRRGPACAGAATACAAVESGAGQPRSIRRVHRQPGPATGDRVDLSSFIRPEQWRRARPHLHAATHPTAPPPSTPTPGCSPPWASGR